MSRNPNRVIRLPENDPLELLTLKRVDELEESAVQSGFLIVHFGEDSALVCSLHKVNALIGPMTRSEELSCVITTTTVFGPGTHEECVRWVEDQRGLFLK